MITKLDEIQFTLTMSLKIIRLYDWLLDLYVLDFFVDNHWNKLPNSWQECFQDINPVDLGYILLGQPTKHVIPLSFLCLLKLVKKLSIPREIPVNTGYDVAQDIVGEYTCANHPRLKNLFLKHVKLKKRHEISLMADVVKDVALETECKTVVDFGSGLGHLMRVLAYKYDVNAVGIECQTQLSDVARKLDQELEYTVRKYLSEEKMSQLHRPMHFNLTLHSEEQLCNLPLTDEMSEYGLIGLHPCGDLGPLLLRHFVRTPKVKFICVVGCCYMKLTCDNITNGYPMSRYTMTLNHKLSFVSREISCHALEVYCDRLLKGDYDHLKVHAFRAALEKILVQIDPKLKHAPVRSIKHTSNMSFERYCEAAVARLPLPRPNAEELLWAEDALRSWRRVATVYSLRLALAPLVESVVLLDRALYLLQHGYSCEIRPVFDPKLSPRNHIIIGRKL